ncbi:MAG: hypothetical protein J7K66_05965 [Anaerolineaceae bacterium]|nr:hypothetical protein [Anaerolineaceae bacterium]
MPEEKKYEEKDEKEMMKHDEKVEERDVLSSIAWGFILMWTGFVFLAANMGWFAAYGFNVDTNWSFHLFSDWHSFGVWNLVALGAGGIVLVESFIRLLVPRFRRNIGGSLIGAAVFIGIGLGGWFNWNYLWPLILIAVGINVLIKGINLR